MRLVIKNNNYTKGEIVKTIREWSGKTQKEFADGIKKSKVSIQKYEADINNFTMQTFLDMAKDNDIPEIKSKIN